jgi:hypothetical protein
MIPYREKAMDDFVEACGWQARLSEDRESYAVQVSETLSGTLCFDELGRLSFSVPWAVEDGVGTFKVRVTVDGEEIPPLEEPEVMRSVLPGIVPRAVLDIQELFAFHRVIPRPEWFAEEMNPDPFLSSPFGDQGISWIEVELTEIAVERIRRAAA